MNTPKKPIQVRTLNLDDLQRSIQTDAIAKALAGAQSRSQAVSRTGQPDDSIDSPKKLGALVRIAREGMDLNQQQFADLAGVGRRFISELENGKPTSEVGLVLQVCRAAGIDIFARRRGRHDFANS